MIIRHARPADVEAIGGLWMQLVRYHQELDTAMPAPAADGIYRYQQRISSSLNDPHVQVFVAEVESRVVGYVLAVVVDLLPEMFEQERSGFIADIFVAPEQRGQGIGRSLVRAVEDWLRARGVTYYEWYVAQANTAGGAFWRSLGGRAVMLRMRRDLEENENDHTAEDE